MPRKTNTAAPMSADLPVLEKSAIAAVKAIDGGYAAASKAILAYTLGAKHASATPAVFEAGITRIAESSPSIAIVSVRGYVSNARRIFAASEESLAKAVKEAGTESIKALAAACPAVSKNGGAGTKKGKGKAEESAPVDPKAPSAPVVKSAGNDPLVNMANALVELRKIASGKKKARIILATVGEIEDMIDEIKSLMAA